VLGQVFNRVRVMFVSPQMPHLESSKCTYGLDVQGDYLTFQP
jgi:hypothetical protein